MYTHICTYIHIHIQLPIATTIATTSAYILPFVVIVFIIIVIITIIKPLSNQDSFVATQRPASATPLNHEGHEKPSNKSFQNTKAAMKAKKKKVLFLKAIRVVGQSARDRSWLYVLFMEP